MHYIKLNNGVEMPQLGLGTFLIPEDKMTETIGKAYELGYRQFDTAWRYHNEGQIAKALKDNGIRREDVFITTKINADGLYKSDYKYGLHRFFNRRNGKTIKQIIQESFDNLQTDYIDLFLIHWPWPMSPKMWKELSALYEEGRIRAIGVSNFLQPHLEALADNSDIIPAVNQFEISPLNTNKELIKYCHDRGIAVEAMSTFSHYRSVEPRNEIIQNPILQRIAAKHKKSVVQIVLRWMQQQGIIMIPKTWNHDYLKENISIFDFELDEDEMGIVDSLNKGMFLNYNPLSAKEGLPRKYRKWEGFKEWEKYYQPKGVSKIIHKILG